MEIDLKTGPEVEAKFRLQPGQSESIAAILGSPARTLTQVDTYYDAGDRVLRLRIENGRPYLTRKDAGTRTPDGIKTRHEVEQPLADETAALLSELLPWLGHKKLMEVAKQRREFEIDGFIVCLDTIAGLEPPDFAEIEAKGGDLIGLRALRDRLGLAEDQVVTSSYARLLDNGYKNN